MAFGFGFNKQKVLSTAEKFVQQGKLQNAISEYEKVLKADPKDLTVLNTVGDLYARLGQNEQAVDRFKSVGDAYAGQGFTVKAIAMYKKLSKIKPSLDSVLRLAELYTQQGLFNDARAQYLQVAEEFLRTGDLEQAVRIFQKTLEMDPENVAMRTRLAEVYVRLGKRNEAWQIFTAAAESLRGRGAIRPAEEILQRMLTLDPGNGQALLLRGRMAFDSGDLGGAIQCLEKVADLDSHADGLRTLLRAYLQTGRLPEAETLAGKLISVHNDTEGVTSYADALLAASRFEDVLQVYQQYSGRLLARDQAKVLDTLHALISHVRGNAPALEALLALLNKAGEHTHLTEVYELLAHACVQSGELEKARDYYLKLTQLEPQNQLHTRNYQQVAGRLGGGRSGSLITAEEGAVLVEELEATAPFVDQRYPSDDVALAVRAALTDAELFVSYNMPAKALGPLEAALPNAPQDLRINQRLAALHTRAGRFAEAGVCCRTLETIYHDAGHPDEASRYGELASKYEERASAGLAISAPLQIEVTPAQRARPQRESTPEPEAKSAAAAAQGGGDAPAPFSAPASYSPTPAAPAPPPARAPGLFWHASAAAAPASSSASAAGAETPPVAPDVEPEIDLSAEWEGALSDGPSEALVIGDQAPPANAAARDEAIAELIEEIRFYAAHSMVEQARATLTKLERLKPEAATLAVVKDEIEAAAARALASDGEEVSVEETDTPAIAEVEPPAKRAAHAPTAAPPQTGGLGEFVSDLETALGDGFLPETPAAQAPRARKGGETVIPAGQQAGRVLTPPASGIAAGSAAGVPPFPATLAASSESAREPAASSSAFTYQPRPPLAPAITASPADVAPGVDLAGMFGELRQELEEGAPTSGEDPETHYNLGVAFREMGLLDEAIGELQKVCQSVDRGHPFPQLMQAYTWLAQCFLDKGVPEAAIRWYERALQIPGLDGDTRIALHYELACSHEAAQNKPLALKHFLEVYGGNIDYRDVAERIKALKS
jgi:tetratricopeptide (TPR) repeat protein